MDRAMIVLRLGGRGPRVSGHQSSTTSYDDEEVGAQEKPYARFWIVAAIMVGFVVFLVFQLFRWQVLEREQLVSIAQAQVASRNGEYIPIRGEIWDCRNHLLAVDIFEYMLWATPQEVRKNNNVDRVSAQLAPLLGLTKEEISGPLKSERPYVLVASHVSEAVWRAIDSDPDLNLTGFDWEIKPKRMYPEGPLGAHILGFVNTSHEGYYGVEGYYDRQLLGQIPEQQPSSADSAVAAWYHPLDIRAGDKLVLTLDRTIQYVAEKELVSALKSFEAPKGAIIVMDPRTGAILAMANFPSFDPNHFMDTPQDRFANPAISEQYEPGSVFKVVTIAAGIDAGVITPRTTFEDTGKLEVGGRPIYNWDRGSNGLVDMTQVLAKSLNTGAAHVSVTLGKNRFYNYVRRFGFGRLTEVDMAGEISGTTKLPGDSDWYESDLGTNAFGQGIAVTPLQMIRAVAAIANRGQLMKPYVVKQVIKGDDVFETEPTVIRRVVSASTAEQVTAMMVRAVETEVSVAYIPGHTIAGKTGTAEIPTPGGYKTEETIASFIGFAPAYDPQFIILVRIDCPHKSPWGSKVAAPVFRRMAEFLFDYMNIPPDNAGLLAR